MYIKKIKRRCDVKGCKNTDTFCISRSSEIGNSVIICKNCLTEALNAVENYTEPKKTAMSNPPALFFGTAAGDTLKNETAADGTDAEKTEINEAVNTAEAIGEETEINIEASESDEESIAQNAAETSNTENNTKEQPNDADLSNKALDKEKTKNTAERKPKNTAKRKPSNQAASTAAAQEGK